MAFENLKEELKENAIEIWGRIQESPAYNSLRERYENLSPNGQRGLFAAIVAIVAIGLIMFPYSYFSSSSDNNDQYVTNRNLIRQLLRANRLAGESLNMPRTVNAGDLKGQISDMLTNYALLPEQNGGTTDISLSDLGPGVAAGKLQVSGVGVKLSKLNLKQIVEIGSDLQSKNPNVKLVGLEMTASSPDPHYFNVLYKLAVYSLPSAFGGGATPPSAGAIGRPKFRPHKNNGAPVGVIAAIFNPIFYVFRKKKKLLLLILASALFFAVLIFPYDDLSDLVMAQAAQQGVYLDFQDMGLSFFPPSLRLNKVSVDVAMLPTVNAGEVYLAPNLMGLLTFSPGFSASVEDFLKGSLSVNYRVGHKTNNVRMQSVALSLDDLDLKGLSRFAQLPIKIEGRIRGDVDGSFDPSFAVQPSGSATIQIDKLHIPSAMVPALMALTLPDTRISQVNLSGTLDSGQLDITDGIIGKPGDNVYGRIKGTMRIQVNNQGGFTYTSVGPYQFNIDLTLDPTIEKNFGSMLSLLNFDQYRTLTSSGARYALKLTGNGPGNPPTPSPIDPNAF